MPEGREEQISRLLSSIHKQPERQSELLAHARTQDPALADEAERLLSTETVSNYWNTTREQQLLKALDTLPPERVGPYKLLEQIGEGGMGLVYLAEQTEPIQRKVALKIIKHGMDTKAVVARFEAERQALAMMDHPNVAKVLDAGATEQGRPYFVMEYVPGESITSYCDRHLLNTEERLRLFISVCKAVQHAHHKAIIHRDLKPSNILVTAKGEAAVPKVIDFGVAKATGPKLTDKTLFTEHGQLIGTPEYMSPEQAEMTLLNVDTRTDVYSLGVVLYELLVGALPFDSAYLRKAALVEVQRIIREEEPPKPSTRLSGLDEDASGVAAGNRRTNSGSLVRQLEGDLDWITLKAMDKDRTRRYATPDALAADIERHLSHEPVVARPPSMAYRIHKFWQRQRIAAVVIIALLMIVSSFASLLTHALLARGQAIKDRADIEQQARADREAKDTIDARQLHYLRMAQFGWFMGEWSAGRVESARRIQGVTNPPTAPEYIAMSLLLGDITEAQARERLAERAPDLLMFALAERCAEAGDLECALESFESMDGPLRDALGVAQRVARLRERRARAPAP